MHSNAAHGAAFQALMQLESTALDLSGWSQLFHLAYAEAQQAEPSERPRDDWQRGDLMCSLSLLRDAIGDLQEALWKDHAALHEAFCAMKNSPPSNGNGGLHVVEDAS